MTLNTKKIIAREILILLLSPLLYILSVFIGNYWFDYQEKKIKDEITILLKHQVKKYQEINKPKIDSLIKSCVENIKDYNNLMDKIRDEDERKGRHLNMYMSSRLYLRSEEKETQKIKASFEKDFYLSDTFPIWTNLNTELDSIKLRFNQKRNELEMSRLYMLDDMSDIEIERFFDQIFEHPSDNGFIGKAFLWLLAILFPIRYILYTIFWAFKILRV